ncbi:MAG: WD40/YVTN/BNR-like repeat-containing protein, partial [Bacteroidota bacterium]
MTYFPVGLFPNESYAYYANSEMVWDPRCWNIVYLGNGNKIWKSNDGGTSFAALYTFPGNNDNAVYDIEVSRSNPDVIYCSQWDGTDDAMWRSNNGGKTWTQLTKLPLPNNNDRVKMALSAEDEDILWVSVSYGSNGKKIYKTTDGGVSWVNLTTPILNNIRITNIMAQYGTDGGIYLGTNAGVFYRNNSMSDW